MISDGWEEEDFNPNGIAAGMDNHRLRNESNYTENTDEEWAGDF